MEKNKDIAEVYKSAISSQEYRDFDEVINFCKNNKKCRNDTSIKKNMMLLWSYKKIASFYEKRGKYEKAYDFWQKAKNLDIKADIKIMIGHNLLFLIDKMKIPIEKKAGEIVKVTGYMRKAYEDIGNQKSVLRISQLQNKAEKLLKKSKYLH